MTQPLFLSVSLISENHGYGYHDSTIGNWCQACHWKWRSRMNSVADVIFEQPKHKSTEIKDLCNYHTAWLRLTLMGMRDARSRVGNIVRGHNVNGIIFCWPQSQSQYMTELGGFGGGVFTKSLTWKQSRLITIRTQPNQFLDVSSCFRVFHVLIVFFFFARIVLWLIMFGCFRSVCLDVLL